MSSMTVHPDKKLNRLLREWQAGTVMTSRWLRAHNYTRQLINHYIAATWIEAIASGAYVRAGDTAKWQGAVYALQQQLNLPVHVGGLTALEMCGLTHFAALSEEQEKIHLFNRATVKCKLPKWMSVRFKQCIHHKFNLFEGADGLQVKELDGITITVSSP